MGVFPLHCTAHQGFYVQRWHCYGQNTDLTGRQMNTYSSEFALTRGNYRFIIFLLKKTNKRYKTLLTLLFCLLAVKLEYIRLIKYLVAVDSVVLVPVKSLDL